MIETSVSLTEFQHHVLTRMVGSSYGSNKSAILRYIVQSYLMEHGDTIRKDLERYEAWKEKTNGK